MIWITPENPVSLVRSDKNNTKERVFLVYNDLDITPGYTVSLTCNDKDNTKQTVC